MEKGQPYIPMMGKEITIDRMEKSTEGHRKTKAESYDPAIPQLDVYHTYQ